MATWSKSHPKQPETCEWICHGALWGTLLNSGGLDWIQLAEDVVDIWFLNALMLSLLNLQCSWCMGLGHRCWLQVL